VRCRFLCFESLSHGLRASKALKVPQFQFRRQTNLLRIPLHRRCRHGRLSTTFPGQPQQPQENLSIQVRFILRSVAAGRSGSVAILRRADVRAAAVTTFDVVGREGGFGCLSYVGRQCEEAKESQNITWSNSQQSSSRHRF
ncbi:hypothetical protein V8G54_026516, partial [Vigna mungo]